MMLMYSRGTVFTEHKIKSRLLYNSFYIYILTQIDLIFREK